MFANISKNIIATFLLTAIFLGLSIYLSTQTTFQSNIEYNRGILLQLFHVDQFLSPNSLSIIFFIVHLVIGVVINIYFIEIKYNRNDILVPVLLYFLFLFIAFKFIFNIQQLILELYLFFSFLQFSKIGDSKKTMQYFLNLGLISGLFYLLDRSIAFYLPMFLILVGIYGSYGLRDLIAFVIGFLGMMYIAFSFLYIGHLSIDSVQFVPNIELIGLENKVIVPISFLFFTLINIIISAQSIKSFLLSMRSFFMGVLVVFVFSAGLFLLYMFRYQYQLYFVVLLNPIYCNIVLKGFRKNWKKDVYILFLIITGIILNFIV